MRLKRTLLAALVAALLTGCGGAARETALAGIAQPVGRQPAPLRGDAQPVGRQPAPLRGDAQPVGRQPAPPAAPIELVGQP